MATALPRGNFRRRDSAIWPTAGGLGALTTCAWRGSRLAPVTAFFLLLAGLTALPSHVSPAGALAAKTYYVSPSGRDTASGTSPTTGWQTLERASRTRYGPGDRLLLKGGATFSGILYFEPGESGTPAAPIQVSSYDVGRAIIDGGAGTGFYAYNAAGINVSNVKFVGSGLGTNFGNGIAFYNDLAGNVKLPHIRVTDVEVSGFGKYGISVGGFNGASGYRNVAIANSVVRDNVTGGLITYGPNLTSTPPVYANEDVHVASVRAYNNLGNPNETVDRTGNGIVVGSANRGTIEKSIAYNNGAQSKNAGPVGIWTYDSRNVTIQFNESYSNKTGMGADGGGFGLDNNTTDSVLQYNYSHDNDGAGYMLYSKFPNTLNNGNIVRYNIGQNDGRKNSYGGLRIGGHVYNASVYGNTVFTGRALVGAPPVVLVKYQGGLSNIKVRNNIFYAQGGVPVLSAPYSFTTNAVQFQGNDYFSSGATLRIVWAGTTYNYLSTWRTATAQEQVGTSASGFSVDPKLVAPGSGGTIGDPNLLTTLGGYKLQATSPLINAGLNLSGLFGVNPGPRDYFGGPVPAGSSFDVGAHEYR